MVPRCWSLQLTSSRDDTVFASTLERVRGHKSSRILRIQNSITVTNRHIATSGCVYTGGDHNIVEAFGQRHGSQYAAARCSTDDTSETPGRRIAIEQTILTSNSNEKSTTKGHKRRTQRGATHFPSTKNNDLTQTKYLKSRPQATNHGRRVPELPRVISQSCWRSMTLPGLLLGKPGN